MTHTRHEVPEGISSLLDTDLYKLTMQRAVLKHFPRTEVSYALTNRTPHMQLSTDAFEWLKRQVNGLGDLRVTPDEIEWLRKTCHYFDNEYLNWLSSLRLKPAEQVQMNLDCKDGSSHGELTLNVHGIWSETILYEIPLLALISEAYFRFVDTTWTHDGQVKQAKRKGVDLLAAGCVFSEFGSRRRRDYYTHKCVIEGLIEAAKEQETAQGKFTGTSNVHLAMQFGLSPVGTVAHEWFMGIAALDQDYTDANRRALQYWVETFGPGVLAIALTDTFGTPSFLRAFSEVVSTSDKTTFAQIFAGVRQDSGDPLVFAKLMQEFYNAQGIDEKKSIIFSDSLDVAKCIQYKAATEAAGLAPSFGVGTFFTNDFSNTATGEKSVPMNIVIKLSRVNGNPTVKLSDNKGKNMGPADLISKVKAQVGYTEKQWSAGDEAHRWDAPGQR